MTGSEKIEGAAEDGAAPRGWRRIWRAVSDSAWGSLAGKGFLYVASFSLLAIAGAGRIHCLTVPASSSSSAADAGAPLPTASATPPASAAFGPDAGVAPSDASSSTEPDAGAGSATKDGKIVLNLATEEDLCRLPGIGATRAKAILALRARLGRFTRVEELLRVKGIGRRSLARLRPLVLVD